MLLLWCSYTSGLFPYQKIWANSYTSSGASPKTTKRVFSPEDHKNRVSQFKLREIEKKKALDERRKKQAEELEKKRIAIMKKHEAADRRVNTN